MTQPIPLQSYFKRPNSGERCGARSCGILSTCYEIRSIQDSASKIEARVRFLTVAARLSMQTPLPGGSVRGSRTGRPIMALLDLLGRRWILRILWELREESLGFRALQARCGRMSNSVLSKRLRDLGRARIVEQDERAGLPAYGAGRALARRAAAAA